MKTIIIKSQAQIEEAIAKIAEVMPGSVVVLEDDAAEKYAVDILMALANLIKVNKGKKVSRGALWDGMVDTVKSGLLAANRLCDADLRKMREGK